MNSGPFALQLCVTLFEALDVCEHVSDLEPDFLVDWVDLLQLDDQAFFLSLFAFRDCDSGEFIINRLLNEDSLSFESIDFFEFLHLDSFEVMMLIVSEQFWLNWHAVLLDELD